MKSIRVEMVSLLIVLLCSGLISAQQTAATATNAQVPPVIQFSNVAADEAGNPLSGTLELTFSLYNNAQGGEPLWTETQTVQLDSTGHYSIYLGITQPNGVPMSLFSTGQAHWLGVQRQGQPEEARVFLVSVPYAMKAGDAATIGGLPPSAFVMASVPNSSHLSNSNGKPNTKTPATETQDYIPFFTDGSGDLGNSILYEAGGNEIGIGTTSPTATLEVNGTAKFDGLATFNSAQTFPGTLTGVTAGTGISVTGSKTDPTININTTFANEFYPQLAAANTFTKSQTITGNLTLNGTGNGVVFPNGTKQTTASTGTITGVNTASGSGLTGGGTSGTLNLALTNTCATNQVLQWNGSTWVCSSAGSGTITGVTAGTDLTGGGTGGNVTLNLNTSNTDARYAQLAASNIFSGQQNINNTTIMTGADTKGVLQVTNTNTSGFGPAIFGTTNSSGAYAVTGVVAATSGTTAGVRGETSSTAGYGVLGTSPWTGVYGTSPLNVGVKGQLNSSSNTGMFITGAGAWGDAGDEEGGGFTYIGVLGTADDNIAGYFQNNSGSVPALIVINAGSGGGCSGCAMVLETSGGTPDSGHCTINAAGDVGCTGRVGADAPIEGGARKVSLYAMQSPENWFEDAGSGQLSNGSITIALDPIFAQTVNAGVEYHVFLTPNGDCKGLYVSQKSSASFEVRELSGGTSHVTFDYRIMAKRNGYENVRLADVTEKYRQLEAQRARRTARRSGESNAASVAAASVIAEPK